ncbi:MAG: hypothetical protein ACK58T_30090, partial [Phycisphaerae bacterium]
RGTDQTVKITSSHKTVPSVLSHHIRSFAFSPSRGDTDNPRKSTVGAAADSSSERVEKHPQPDQGHRGE